MTERHAGLAAEAARLLGAVQQAARDWSDGTGEGTAATCRGCPLCQVARRVQHVSPEAVQHLAQAAASFAAALAHLAAEHPPPEDGEDHPAERADPARPDVQHIDVTD